MYGTNVSKNFYNIWKKSVELLLKALESNKESESILSGITKLSVNIVSYKNANNRNC